MLPSLKLLHPIRDGCGAFALCLAEVRRVAAERGKPHRYIPFGGRMRSKNWMCRDVESADMKERREGKKLGMSSGLLGRRAVVENGIEIDASPGAVFDYCTDTFRELEWNPKLLEVEKLTAGPIGLGTRFRIRLDGVRWSTTENIALDRPRFWAASSASRLLDVRIEGEVKPSSRGVWLSVRSLLLPDGVLRLAQPILRWIMRQTGNTTFGGLK